MCVCVCVIERRVLSLSLFSSFPVMGSRDPFAAVTLQDRTGVCVCVCACVRVYVHACECVCEKWERVWVYVCVMVWPCVDLAF